MQRTLTLGKIVLAAAALLGVTLGLLLPAPSLHGGASGRLITPGYSAS